jgi:hypothetical protein
VQFAAQVGQRLGIGGLGPEQPGDALPALGEPAWPTRKATRTTARDDRVRTVPVPSSVIADSPRRDTCNMSRWPPDTSG